jgi:hypothetical protein
LVADIATEREISLWRGAVGIGLLLCSVWLFALPEWLPKLFGVAAVVFAVRWIAAAIGVLRTKADPARQDFLELTHEAITVREHGRELTLPWAEIVRVAIDQDRLTLALLRRTGEIVHIEPRYSGVALEDLCNAASALHSSAQTSGADSTAGS